METVARKPPAAKWNWPVILKAIAGGEDWRAVAKRFSIPEGTIRQKLALERKVSSRVARELGNLEVEGAGKPAPSLQKLVTVAPKSEISAPEPAELTDTQLVTLLSDPQATASLAPADLEKLLARRAGTLVAQGFAAVRAPESVKELVPLAKLFRDLAGLTGDKGKGGGGLLSPQRSYGRRAVAVVDAVEVVEAEEMPDYM